jgi:hypothetical protein
MVDPKGGAFDPNRGSFDHMEGSFDPNRGVFDHMGFRKSLQNNALRSKGSKCHDMA